MGLFANILNWLRGKVKPLGYSAPYLEAENPETREPFSEDSSSEMMLAAYYDEDLFERARTQWQFGDWESLAGIERESLYHHPQRASLALLAAAGHQQQGNTETTREFTRLAKEWGASKKMISQVLIAGVYNTLGKASALCGQQQRALGHFRKSVTTAGDGGDVKLLTQARVEYCFGRGDINKAIGGSSFTLKSQQQNNVQPENANNQYAKPHDEVAPLFSITGKDCEDSEPITLDFYPAESQYFNMEGNLLRFHLGHNKPGYLVTNPSGNFDLAPAEQQQLDLEPDSTYRITGRIAIEEAASLVFWVFEYRKNITANKTSYPCPDGKVSAVFRTGHGFSRVAFGIRVAGEGVIDIASSELYLDSGSAAEQAYEAQQKAAEQKCRAEENKKNLMQLEDFMRLQHYMGSNFIMPDMHSWPISPDMGVLLIRQIEAEQYDAVIEFGSGVSTVVIAKALSRCCNNDIKQPLFLSFDHLEKYYNQTAEYLKRARLNTFVQLKLAPLQPYKGPDGNEYNYYSCAENLKNFKIKLDDNLDGRMPRILAMIDGPPGKTCPHARYPALPLLYSVFEGHCELNLLMDDYVRDDEREIVKKWVEWLQQKGIQFSTEEFLTMEKQACLIRIESSES